MWMNVPSNSVTLKSQSISNKTLRDTGQGLNCPKGPGSRTCNKTTKVMKRLPWITQFLAKKQWIANGWRISFPDTFGWCLAITLNLAMGLWVGAQGRKPALTRYVPFYRLSSNLITYFYCISARPILVWRFDNFNIFKIDNKRALLHVIM